MVKIFFPGWIVRIGCSLNLDMPFDRNIPQLVEGDLLHALLVLPSLYLTIEMPLLVPHGAKIALFHPSSPLAGVPSFGPPPQTVEDGTIHTLKGGFAHDMPVIVSRKVEILGRLYFIEIPQVRCILSHAMMSLLPTGGAL